jgi:NTE family protein
MIDASQLDTLLRTDTKLLAHGPFFEQLQEQGRTCADAWLAKEYHAVGRRSSIDVKQLFG